MQQLGARLSSAERNIHDLLQCSEHMLQQIAQRAQPHIAHIVQQACAALRQEYQQATADSLGEAHTLAIQHIKQRVAELSAALNTVKPPTSR
ncbi:unnamed protein product [Agarophyton chilense]